MFHYKGHTETSMVACIWNLDLYLPMQSEIITNQICEVDSHTQAYVQIKPYFFMMMKFALDSGFLTVIKSSFLHQQN